MNKKIILSLQITEAATNKIKSLITSENNPKLKLRIYITCGGCGGFQYGFSLDEKINEDDLIIRKNGVVLVSDLISLRYLVGSKIDYIETLEGSRFCLTNLKKAKHICGCGFSFSI